MVNNKKTILCFVNCYLPGYKYGGPIKSISNFVKVFGDKFNIKIICKDRDHLELKPYKTVKINTWNRIGKADVYYASKEALNFFRIKRLVQKTNYDLIYLNSFFSFNFTIIPILLLFLKIVPNRPCILAPRGEFSDNALKLNKIKKFFYIFVSKKIGLYTNLYWPASSKIEKKDILKHYEDDNRKILIAPNIVLFNSKRKIKIKKKKQDTLKLVFYSRISPMKNLDFLLRVISKLSFKVKLDIYGVRENIHYYNLCKKLKKKITNGSEVTFFTKINNLNDIKKKFINYYDLFILPTRGENFGHTIYESLSLGLPVMISNKTPWKKDEEGGVVTVALKNSFWVQQLQKWNKYNSLVRYKKKVAAIKYAKNYNIISKSIEKNYKLFSFFCT